MADLAPSESKAAAAENNADALQSPTTAAAAAATSPTTNDISPKAAVDDSPTKKTPGKRTPSKRMTFVERAQKESEELVKTMGGKIELEGGRRTRSSTRGTPLCSPVVVSPPPAKKARASQPSTPTSATPKKKGRAVAAKKSGRGLHIEAAAEPADEQEENASKEELATEKEETDGVVKENTKEAAVATDVEQQQTEDAKIRKDDKTNAVALTAEDRAKKEEPVASEENISKTKIEENKVVEGGAKADDIIPPQKAPVAVAEVQSEAVVESVPTKTVEPTEPKKLNNIDPIAAQTSPVAAVVKPDQPPVKAKATVTAAAAGVLPDAAPAPTPAPAPAPAPATATAPASATAPAPATASASAPAPAPVPVSAPVSASAPALAEALSSESTITIPAAAPAVTIAPAPAADAKLLTTIQSSTPAPEPVIAKPKQAVPEPMEVDSSSNSDANGVECMEEDADSISLRTAEKLILATLNSDAPTINANDAAVVEPVPVANNPTELAKAQHDFGQQKIVNNPSAADDVTAPQSCN